MKLYYYDHCPYCVKARMIFGLKNIAIELQLLLNDDEATPMGMIGAKQVPILERDDGTYLPESLDIVREIDGMDGNPVLDGAPNPALSDWIAGTRDYLNPLVMPRWALAPFEEFATPPACAYFIQKKEAYIGGFAEHRARSAEYIALADKHLALLETLIVSERAAGGILSTDDLHVFAALCSLSIVSGITYPPTVEAYRQHMSAAAKVPLHDVIAR